MSEYLTKAFVLNFKITKENDKIYNLFTENFGRLNVVAPGSLKILSRLSGHLEIGNLLKVKIVEKNALTIVDALTLKNFLLFSSQNNKFLSQALMVANILKTITPLGVPDWRIWNLLLNFFKTQNVNFKELLSFLGYDVKNGRCALCGKKTAFVFDLYDQNFLCEDCSLNFPSDHLLYI